MLTDAKCRNAKPTEKPYKLTDNNDLFLEMKPNGVKAWRYRFTLRGAGKVKESLFAPGEYATAPNGETLEEAKARRALGLFHPPVVLFAEPLLPETTPLIQTRAITLAVKE